MTTSKESKTIDVFVCYRISELEDAIQSAAARVDVFKL